MSELLIPDAQPAGFWMDGWSLEEKKWCGSYIQFLSYSIRMWNAVHMTCPRDDVHTIFLGISSLHQLPDRLEKE